MRNRFWIAVVSAALGLGALGGARAATAPASSAPPVHRGLLSRLRHPRPALTNHPAALTGSIIGNKHTHVYHLPGEKGSLPAAQNRVYFHSVAAARAAGYHPAGQPAAGLKRPRSHMAPAPRLTR